MKKTIALLMCFATFTVAFSSCSVSDTVVEQYNSEMCAYEGETEITTEIVNSYTVNEYEADGVFSEGLVFVEYTDTTTSAIKYGYVDAQGNVAFNLPAGYVYGYEFHDGLAVIVNEHSYWYGEWITSGYKVIDKKGNIVFDASEYSSISRASEGYFSATKKIETYAGTTNNFYLLDYKGNVVTIIERKLYPDSFIGGFGYMQYGSVYVDGCFYDKDGNIVKDFRDVEAYWADSIGSCKQSEDTTKYCVFSDKIFDREKLEIVSEGHKGMVSDNGYSAHHKYNSKTKKSILIITDINGNTNQYEVEGLRELEIHDTCDDDRWIVRLENGFYSIVNEKGEFIIEPVKGAIYYMGESKYYLASTGEIIDLDGNSICKIGSEKYRNDRYNGGNYFSEGIIVMSDGRLMNDKGEYINELTISC